MATAWLKRPRTGSERRAVRQSVRHGTDRRKQAWERTGEISGDVGACFSSFPEVPGRTSEVFFGGAPKRATERNLEYNLFPRNSYSFPSRCQFTLDLNFTCFFAESEKAGQKLTAPPPLLDAWTSTIPASRSGSATASAAATRAI